MKHLSIVLLVVVAAVLSLDSFAQTNRIEGMKNQIEQARKEVMDKIPKVPQVPHVPNPHMSPYKKKGTSVLREFRSKILDYKVPESILLATKYPLLFASLSKDSTATGEDYLQLYFTMGCDSLYSPIICNLKLETVADKYLDIDSPTPERLGEVLAIARQQFPKQRLIGPLQTPSALLLERATQRYYSQVLAADSTFTKDDAAILSQLFDEYRRGWINEGSTLYFYLTELYEYAIPPLERYYKTFEDHPTSDRFINRHINEIVPKFKLLEKCYEAIGYTERRDSLIAKPTYQRIIKTELKPEASR